MSPRKLDYIEENKEISTKSDTNVLLGLMK